MMARSLVPYGPPKRRFHYAATSALLSMVLVSAACSGASDPPTTGPLETCDLAQDETRYLCGTELQTPSGLILVMGDSLVDVDTNSRQRIVGLPVVDVSTLSHPWDRVFSALQVGSDAVIACTEGCGAMDVFAIGREDLTATPIGKGHPAPGVNSVWLKNQSAAGCTLTEVSLVGEILRAPAPIDCEIRIVEEAVVGLVGSTYRDGVISGVILNPDDLTIATTDIGEVIGTFQGYVLHHVRGRAEFSLLDTRTGDVSKIEVPTRVGQPSYGLLSPNGKYLAVSFADQTWAFDLWILDTELLEWAEVLSMPASAFAKATDIVWASDGRLVIVGEFEGAGGQVSTWVPGEPELQVQPFGFETYGSIAALCTTEQCP